MSPSPAERARQAAFPGGAAPLVAVDHGLAPDISLGGVVSGSSLGLRFRGDLSLSPLLRLRFGVLASGGAASIAEIEGQADAYRLGGQVPLALALDLFGIYEAWIGARAGLDYSGGELTGLGGFDALGLRVGGFVGLGIGFRRVHLLLELAVDYEHWSGSVGGVRYERAGAVLTPAFALRIRFGD